MSPGRYLWTLDREFFYISDCSRNKIFFSNSTSLFTNIKVLSRLRHRVRHEVRFGAVK